jgi:hypothetical protein
MLIDDRAFDVVLAKAGLILLSGAAALAYLIRLAATIGPIGRQQADAKRPLLWRQARWASTEQPHHGTKAGRAENRRVEMKISANKGIVGS